MEGIVSKDRLLGGRTFTQVKHVTIMQKHHINNIATYTLLCSALGIGVLLLMFSIIPVLAGASPTTPVKVYVWIIFFALIVFFVLSLIYCILDVGQCLLGRSDKKEVMDQQTIENCVEPIETDNDDYNEQNPAAISELAPEENVVSTEPKVETRHWFCTFRAKPRHPKEKKRIVNVMTLDSKQVVLQEEIAPILVKY